MHNPNKDHMNEVIKILRYLKSSPAKEPIFKKHNHLNACGHTDRSNTDRKYTSRYFTFMGGYLIAWRSKKQKVVSLSSAEAEFRGMVKELCD